jgi:hypothetical protein
MRGLSLIGLAGLVWAGAAIPASAAPALAGNGPGLSVQAPGPSAAIERVDLELLFGVDVSRSIDPDEARLQRDGYVAAFRDPAVVRTIVSGRRGRIAVSYVEWANDFHKRLVADWTVIDGEAAALAFADHLAAMPLERGPMTSISGIIDYAVPRFDENRFEGFRRILDISGDGPNNNGRLVTEARDVAVAAGITINGLPIVNDRPSPWGLPPLPDLDLYFDACVIGGFGAFIVVAEGFETFARAIRKKLILEIAGLTPTSPRPAIVPAALKGGRPSDPLAALLPIAGEPLRGAPKLRRVTSAVRTPPPCDIGERMYRQRMRFWDDR